MRDEEVTCISLALREKSFATNDLQLQEYQSGRIKQLKFEKQQLENQINKLERESGEHSSREMSLRAIKVYTNELKELLAESFLSEQKAFLRSFIKRIEVSADYLTIEYSILQKQKRQRLQ